MEYKLLGNTGVKVSNLTFGTMNFGKDADKNTSFKLFERCRDAGINMFDCANVYSKGEAEKILGECIKNCRDELIITTKVHFTAGDNINDRGSSRKHIFNQIDKSLKRLNTDYIDIYFLHGYDENTDLEETLRTMDDLVKNGKILYNGISNFSAWQIEKAIAVAQINNLNKIKCIQPMYNLVKRQAEVEILPMAKHENLAVFSYNPLGAGLLTGKYFTEKEKSNPDIRINRDKKYTERYGDEWMREVALRFFNFARENKYDPAALAIAWVMHNPAVTAPILGARNLEQLNSCLTSLDIKMTDDLYDKITSLSIKPPSPTDRSEKS
ncbi:MAG: aldo/keto reductase [Spirochaetes bacterium]|nr:aldo/keto reductase [Spirochaetota bacterium]